MDIRICFIGDSFVNGAGDPTYLGWTGRVCQSLQRQGYDLTHYNLGVRRETSIQIEQRWRQEALRRLPDDCEGRLVFSFGVNDTTEEDDALRVFPDDSTACTHRILSFAKTLFPVLMVGPPPIGDPDQNQRTEALSQQFAQICAELGIPYLPTYPVLSQTPVWQAEVVAGDGAHPAADGYAQMAELVLNWSGWQKWIESGQG